MSHRRTLKLKCENKGKKIFIPQTYNELLEKVKECLPNNDPNKIYQIFDIKFQTIIKDQNDYQLFNVRHASNDKITLLINLIDKKDINKIPDYQPESSSIFFESCILPKQEEKEEKHEEKHEEKELTEEEKIKESIRLLVRAKLKNLENNILNEISNKEQPIHKGIKCNQCGKEDIKGVRYKCSTCANYNLCEECEDNTDHNENHLFIKIKEPIYEENELNEK